MLFNQPIFSLRIKKIILIISSLIFILSCQNQEHVDLVLENIITLNTPIGFYPYRVSVLNINEDTNLVLFNWRQGELYIYENNKVKYRKYNNFRSIFVKSLDSIFLIDKYKGNILLTNSNFDSLNSWKISKHLNNTKYLLNTNLKSNFIDLNNKLYLTVYPNIHRDSFYTKQHEIIYNLNNRVIERLYKKFPSNYSKLNYWHGTGNYIIRALNNKNEIIFMYPMNKNIFKMKGNVIEEIELPESKYLNDFPPDPYPYPTPKSSQFATEFSIKSPSYVNLHYDKYRNLYYKIVDHSQPVSNGKLKNTHNSKNWSIMIFNEDFELLDEIKMDGNKYFNDYFYILKEGIYILLQDKDNFDTNIKLQKFKVNYEK